MTDLAMRGVSGAFVCEKDHSEQARTVGSPWFSSRLLTPHLTVKDTSASKTFYEKAFGFEVRYEKVQDSVPVHVEMAYMGELVLMLVPENLRNSGNLAPVSMWDPQQKTAYFYLYVKDVDHTTASAEQAGARVLEAAHDAAWGDRFSLVCDPNGYHWGLAQSKNFPSPPPPEFSGAW